VKIWFIPLNPTQHRFRVEREGREPIDVALETRSLLLHDLAHYAVEATEELAHGFYGLLAAGTSLESLRDPDGLSREAFDALMLIERRVAMTQSAFKKRGPGNDAASRGLRQLWGAWSKTRHGSAMRLEWPELAPEVVVSAPPAPGS